MVEQCAVNALVVGSNPASGDNKETKMLDEEEFGKKTRECLHSLCDDWVNEAVEKFGLNVTSSALLCMAIDAHIKCGIVGNDLKNLFNSVITQILKDKRLKRE